jgi:predicted nucleotidyltransferase
MPENGDKPLPVSSSHEPNFPEDQQRLFHEVLQLLKDRGVPYVVSGAFALHAHTGIWRDTKDLDIFLAPDKVASALAYLREDGFECEVCDPVWLAKAHRDDFFVDLITGMSNGVIVVDESWIARSRPRRMMGVETRVLAAEELIASKLFVTRRERFDGADICHVIYGTRGQLDWPRLFALVGEHWEILLWALVLYRYSYPAQSDYVPREVWDDLLGRFQQAVRFPDRNARFRGSLIDENMFAIDVKEWGLDDMLEEMRRRRRNPDLSKEMEKKPAA